MSTPTTAPAAARTGAAADPDVVGDVWGGLAAMLVALPSAIAFGVAIYGVLGTEYAGLGALAGVLGTVAIGLIAPVFGGAPRLISAPCGPAAAVMGGLAASMAAGGVEPDRAVLLMTLVALLSALLQLGYGAVGGGTLIKYIPYPVVSGYLTGVGLILILKQIDAFLGVPKTLHGWHALLHPGEWALPSLVVALATIAGMTQGPKLTKKLPPAVLGLGAGLLSYFGLAFAARPELLQLEGNRFLIGPLAADLGGIGRAFAQRAAAVTALELADLKLMVVPALTLSVLLSIDTLKTCVIVDAMTRSRHDSNKELRGQGLGNLAAAALGGVPGAGTMGATLVNISSGGRTRLSSILEGVFALVALVALGRLLAWIPVAALAGILVVVGARMIDRSSFQLLKDRTTALDFFVIMAVVGTALGVGLIAASGVGVALAMLLFIREQIRGSVIRRKSYGDELFSKEHRLPEHRELLEKHGGGTVAAELQGSLFFGTTDQLFSELEADLKACKVLILDMKRVQSVDFTAAHRLEQMAAMLQETGGRLVLSSLPPTLPTGQDLKAYFDQLGLVRSEGGHGALVFETLDLALEWAEDQLLAGLGVPRQEDEKPLDLAEVELFRELDPAAIATLRQVCQERSVAAGEAVIHKKDKGDEMFLIRRGEVDVILPLKHSGKHHRLASFGRGDFFGEGSFLTHKKRTADVVADRATDLYVLSRSEFDALSRREPAVGAMVFARLALAVALRLRDTDKDLRKLQDS